MKSKGSKTEEHLAKHEVASLLRALADAVENDDHESLTRFGIDLQASKKIKIDLKEEGLHLSLRLKIKPGDKEEAPVSRETTVPRQTNKNLVPAFKNLKKRMKMDFAVIVASLKGDTLPLAATVHSFLADAELMLSYRGNGDEYYDVFLRDCHALREAFREADTKSCQDAIAAISARMRECHKLYK